MLQWTLRTLFWIGILVLVHNECVEAGGSTFTAEITTLEYAGDDEFILVLRQYDLPYDRSQAIEPKTLTIHLRYTKRLFNPSKLHTASEYRHAINLLLQQYRQGGKFQFGVWANGFEPIEDRPGEFQSNGLTVIEGVVMSWGHIE